ncbi:MAG: aldo/keto reductase [Anaerolineae bacterium]|nr:aldo/keto reductase [Anaerolineae bacterium]
MNHEPLGTTSLNIPRIAFGTTSLGNIYQVIPKEVKLAIVKEIFQHVEKPMLLDSAGKYGAGLALEVIGWALQELAIAPDDVIISNKLAWLRTALKTPEPTFEPGAWFGLEHDAVQDISYDGILRCWEQGHELLGGVYTSQMVSVHDPDEYLASATSDNDRKKRFDDIMAAYEALFDLKKKGLVQAVGVGAKDWKSIQEIAQVVQLDWVMFANSFTLYTHPTELVKFMRELQEKQIAIINSAVFNAGFLTGGEYFDYRKVDPQNEADKALFQWRNEFFAICQQFQIKPADACVQFGLSHPAINSVAMSTSKPERVKQNVDLVSNELSADFWVALRKAGLLADDYPYLRNDAP